MDQTKARALVNFISWVITSGQTFASNLGYVPLPAEVVKDDQDTLKLLTNHPGIRWDVITIHPKANR